MAFQNSRRKILIIDDEEVFGRLMKLNLEGAGAYEVRMEITGERGCAAAKEFKPDLIFLDVVMPDMGGEQVLQRLKSDETTKQIAVVFLTATVRESEVNNGFLAGFPVLAKPASLEEILHCIERNPKPQES